MANRNSVVSIKVDRNFFKNVFEPQRKQLEFKLGQTLSQRELTAMCNKMSFRLKLPKTQKNIFGNGKFTI